MQAAILGAKLPYLAEWTAGRRANARRYNELLREYGLLDVIEPPRTLADRDHVYNQYTVRVRGGRRDEVLQKLRADSIGCAIYYPTPLQLQECFSHLGYQEGDLPESELAASEVMALPIFPELADEQQERVVAGIAKALGRMPADGTLSEPTLSEPTVSFPERRAA